MSVQYANIVLSDGWSGIHCLKGQLEPGYGNGMKYHSFGSLHTGSLDNFEVQ